MTFPHTHTRTQSEGKRETAARGTLSPVYWCGVETQPHMCTLTDPPTHKQSSGDEGGGRGWVMTMLVEFFCDVGGIERGLALVFHQMRWLWGW